MVFLTVDTVHTVLLIGESFLLRLTGGAGVADRPAEGDGRGGVRRADEGLHLEHTQVWTGKEPQPPQPLLVIIVNFYTRVRDSQGSYLTS